MNGISNETAYTFDAVGNRLTKTVDGSSAEGSGPQADIETVYTYDANDRMTSDGVQTYTYDNNGNTLSDGVKSYTYDSKNKLISFTDAADTGIYTYDTAGRRLSKTYGGSTTEYLYCTTCRYAQVLEKRDGLGKI